MKKIYICIFLGSLFSSSMNEKKKKREKVAGAGMGYYPFSKIESQYSRLYCGT